MFWPQFASAVPHWCLSNHWSFTSSSVCSWPEILPSVPKGLCTAACCCITAEGRYWGWLGNAGKRGLLGCSLHISHFNGFRCLSVSFSFHLLFPQVHDTLVLQFTQSLWTDEHLMRILSEYIFCMPGADQGLNQCADVLMNALITHCLCSKNRRSLVYSFL